MNNTIKVTKRMSYGMKSFERLKKKILNTMATRNKKRLIIKAP
ncbi:hypothetical protein [Paraliobacillus sp. JSM ZJ581]